MSTESYENQTRMAARDRTSSRTGELMMHDRISTRGKGSNEKLNLSFVAIFTFDDPIFCTENEIPENGGYFVTEKGEAEVTQLIGRFDTKNERDKWVSNTFHLTASK